MKKLNYLFILLLVCILNANAQTWEYYKDWPINVKPVDIDVNNAGTLFMLTSEKTIFYKLLNQDWQEMPTFPAGNPECISVVKNSNRLYFGDYMQGLVYTDNFGQSWQQTWLTTNPISGFHESVVALSNISNPNLFFGATFGALIKYTSNGQNGQFIVYDSTNNFNNDANEIFITSSNVTLIGTENGGIWKSTPNGSTFQQTNQNQHKFLRFTEGNGKVYALGYNSIQNHFFLVSSTDFMNWESVITPSPTEKYTSILFDSSTQSLWLGSETGLYKSDPVTANAPTWNSATYNNLSQFTVEIVKSGSKIHNFSNEFIAQQIDNSNTNWNAINQGLRGSVNYAGFGSNNKIFAASYNNNTVSSANDAQSTWSNTSITGNTIIVFDMIVRPNGKIYLDMGTSIKKSIDNGLTYTDITPPNMTACWRLHVGENNSLFASLYGEREKLYRSTDDGATWSLFGDFTSEVEWDPAIVENISEDSNGVVYVVTESLDIFFGVNTLRYTTDQGVTWNSISYVDQSSCSFTPLVMSSGDKTYFSACSRAFTVNIANSSPFQPYTFPWGTSGFLHPGAFKKNSQGHQYILKDALYKSVDNGVTWTNLGLPSEFIHGATDVAGLFIDSNDDVFVKSSTYIYLPSSSWGFYKITETLGVENPESNPVSVYPNPASNLITIQTTHSISNVSVYDMQGKNVLNVNDNIIDVSNLSNGLYLIKIEDSQGNKMNSKFVKN